MFDQRSKQIKKISKPLGVVSALIAVLIWGGWIVATRKSLVSGLSPQDVGLLRFGIPAIIFAPIWLRIGLFPKGVPLKILLPLLGGSGALFSLSMANGMSFAPAAHTGALVPGTIPLWAAIIGFMIFRERFSQMRIVGLLIMASCALLLGGASAVFDSITEGFWRGHLLFLFSAFVWACYAHAFQRSGLTAIQAVAVSSLWSGIVHIVLALIFGTSLISIGINALIWEIIVQGFLSGVVAFLAFSLAVSHLGPTRASAFTSLVPAIAGLGAWIVIGEALEVFEIIAILGVTIGVIMASGLVSGKSR